jgi:mono/diheme cytochrome c family protein
MLTVLATLVVLSRVEISAMPDPGRTEAFLAAKVKRLLIRRSSRGIKPPIAANRQLSAVEAKQLFGVDCAVCHGEQGTTPTDFGRSMYPRAPSLSAPEVQQYSDAELFWIVKNGIHLSGMPAFGKVERDADIWDVVHYVRSLSSTRAGAAAADGR